jgi:hypothetical protein
MDLRGKKLSDTYVNLLSTGPLASDQTITLGNGAVVPWEANGIVVAGGSANQTIGGSKTFNGTLTIPSTLNFASNGSIVKAGNHAVTLTTSSNSNITFSSATAFTYTVPNPGTNASFVMTEGAQTINGNKTFNGEIKIFGDTEIGLTGTATNLFGTGASTNRFGDNVITSNSFGNNVIGLSATNSFGNSSRYNTFGETSNINRFGLLVTGSNQFGSGVSGSTASNGFGIDLRSGAINNFGKNSKNFFGENGENYFYSGSFAGPLTLPATVSYTSAGQIVKAGNHTLGLTTTAGTTGIFPTGNINIAALEGQQTFAGEKTFSSGINILKTTDQLVLGSTQKTTITAPTPASARTYTIPDVSGNASFVMSEGGQTIGGTKTFTTGVILQNTSNQLAFRTGSAGTNTITFTAPNISGNRTYTIPDVSGNASFVMTSGNQTINGTKNFTSRPTINGSGVFLSGEAVPGAYTAYSLVFGSGLRLTNGGAPFSWNGNQEKTVEIDTSAIASLTGSQTLNGTKTFNNGIIINTGSNQLQLGTTNKLTITTNPAASRTYTIPDVGGNADFVMTSGSQNIAGTKTFASQIIIQTGSNQLVLRTGSAGSNSFTISAPTISGNRTYTIPDVSGNSSFVMTTGTQDIGGSKNFTTRPTVNGVNMLLSGDTSIFTRVEATNLVYNTGDQIISGRKRFRNASVVPYGPFVNDVDADFNGLLSSREIYFTNDGNTRSAIEIPTLDMVYETGATTLTPRIGPTPTFTRTQTNTSGSYLASDGFIKYLAADQPRFDHAVSKNLFFGPENLSEWWRYPEYNVGFTEKMMDFNVEVNPFKSVRNATKIIEITGSGVAAGYLVRRDATLNSGFNYTMSVFAKPINNNFIVLTLAGGTRAFYNLSNGSISGMGGGTIISSGIDSSYGNGWSRLWLSIAYNSPTASHVNSITSSNSTGALTKIVATRSDAFYLFGPQLEESAAPTPYEPAYGTWSEDYSSSLTGRYKSLRAPKGLLLERSSSNYILNSNTFTGSNAGGSVAGNIQLTGGVWPDSSVSGSVLVETNTTAFQGIYRDAVTSITSGTNYVSSIFLKQPYYGQYSYTLTGVGGSITGTGYYSFSNGVVFQPGQGNVPSSANPATYSGGLGTGRRYVLGRFVTNGIIPDTRVVIDLHSGISGGRTIPVPGYTTPTFYTGIKYPNNWYRLIIGQQATGTTGNGGSFFVYSTTGFGVDGAAYSGLNGPGFQIFGHQLETAFSGDGATSYKPTTGSVGTLTRDVFAIGGNDFSGFYNQSEGTYFIEAELLQYNTWQTMGMMGIEGVNRQSGSYSFNRVSSNFRFDFSSSPPSHQLQAQFVKNTGSLDVLAIASYKENNFKASFYNETTQTDTSGRLGSLPMNKLVFGANGETSGPQFSDMYLKRFSYWPLQFQDSKLTGIYRY